MRSFTSEDKFEITGHGTAYSIRGNWDGSGDEWSPRCLTGETVLIDGKEFVVKGVEIFLMYADRDKPYRSNFALLI